MTKYGVYVYDDRVEKRWFLVKAFESLSAGIELSHDLFNCGMQVIIRRVSNE